MAHKIKSDAKLHQKKESLVDKMTKLLIKWIKKTFFNIIFVEIDQNNPINLGILLTFHNFYQEFDL